MLVDPASGQANECPNGEDYSPCRCEFSGDSTRITCATTLEQVSNVFRRTIAADLDAISLELVSADANGTIPADLLSNHRALGIEIYYKPIRVDPQAFRASKDFTEFIKLAEMVMDGFDFTFMTGFSRLVSTQIARPSNIISADWTSWPLLPSLESFSIFQSKGGLNDWTTFPRLSRGLNRLDLSYNEIQDEAMDRILNWTVQYSADTLQELWVTDNDLAKIPWQLPVRSFPKLETLGLGDQRAGISFIPSGSFYHLADRLSVYYLYSPHAKIGTIQDGAFQGI